MDQSGGAPKWLGSPLAVTLDGILSGPDLLVLHDIEDAIAREKYPIPCAQISQGFEDEYHCKYGMK